MSLRTWASVLAIVCLVAVAVGVGSGAVHPRSEHSRPATYVRDASVIITDKGKLFHRSGCKYIHGTPKTVSSEQAQSEGYTPCTRCFRDAMVNP